MGVEGQRALPWGLCPPHCLVRSRGLGLAWPPARCVTLDKSLPLWVTVSSLVKRGVWGRCSTSVLLKSARVLDPLGISLRYRLCFSRSGALHF